VRKLDLRKYFYSIDHELLLADLDAVVGDPEVRAPSTRRRAAGWRGGARPQRVGLVCRASNGRGILHASQRAPVVGTGSGVAVREV